FAGVRFAYPFLADLLTAMMVTAGGNVISVMWLQNVLFALALAGLVHYWTVLLTRSQLAGFIAPLLIVFSGGLGWTWVLRELHNSQGGLVWLLQHLTHDYPIQPEGILRWGNSLTTLFVPQRSILMGIPLAICIFCQWWQVIDAEPAAADSDESRRRMLAAGF